MNFTRPNQEIIAKYKKRITKYKERKSGKDVPDIKTPDTSYRSGIQAQIELSELMFKDPCYLVSKTHGTMPFRFIIFFIHC